MRATCLLVGVLLALGLDAAEAEDLAGSLLFEATYNESADADRAEGDPRIYTANSSKREVVREGIDGDVVTLDAQAGRSGGALRFNAKQSKVIFYKGRHNVPRTAAGFSGTVSLWMRLSPAEDLPPGYVDPLQITDKTWNDSAFFVDFTEENPRQFRLGAFSEYKFWNPTDRKWDDVPEAERPMVTVTDLPFARDRWTHVALVFRGFNKSTHGEATLYLDGKSRGSLRAQQMFRWDPDQVGIMLGINYVGWIDDLRIYSQALTAEQIMVLGAEQAK